MSFFREYVLCVICAALICGLLQSLIRGSKCEKALKLMCGLFLTYTAVSPLVRLPQLEMPDLPESLTRAAEDAALEGENSRRDALSEVIRRECETYILNKAGQMGMEVQVSVSLDDGDPPRPAAASIAGNPDGAHRQALEEILENDIGIPKERQQWMDG